MTNIKKIVPIIACLILVNAGLAQTNFLKGSWEEIMRKARDQNKPVFVDLYFTGCMPCAEMDKKVFPDQKVARLLNNDFIPFKINVFKEEEKALGEKLMKKYAVTGFPTFLLLAPDQHVIHIESGFIGVEKLVALLNDVKIRNEKREYKDYSPAFDLDYPDFYDTYFKTKKLNATPGEIEAYLDTQTDKMAEVPFLVMMKLVYKGKYLDYYIDHVRELAGKYGKQRVSMSLLGKIPYKAKKLAQDNDPKTYDAILKDVQEIFSESDWKRLSIGSFYQPYYKAGKNASWFINKVQNGNYDWQDRSNAFAQLIIDAKEDEKMLKTLAGIYKKNMANTPTQADIYKAALIQFYLKHYKSAAKIMAKADKAKPSYLLKKEEMTKLEQAISKKNTISFVPKVALDPKSIRMD